tara:strand:- start:127 stop:390 length:264 start_codon:yes stop_codon:yes gene_type:complete
MNIEKFNKQPLTIGIIKIVNNPLTNYKSIITSILFNKDFIDEISNLPFKTDRDKKLVRNFEKANTELRLHKRLYKKECKKKGVYIGS